MSSADILRTPGLAQAITDGATALDQVPQLLQKIAALEAQINPTPTPVPPATGTVFGISIDGTHPIALRQSQIGAAPMVKAFSLIDVARTIPSKRALVCWKPDQAQLASGALDAMLIAYITGQVAAGVKQLWICNWQEPNGEIKGGTVDLATYLAATKHLAQLVQAHGVKGVTRVAQVFTAPQARAGVAVPDGWIVPIADLGGVDWSVLCYDNYANPAGASSYGGNPYATPYPSAASVCDEMLAQAARLGYGRNWAWTELGCPWRKNVAGGDADQSQRIACLEAVVQRALTSTVVAPPLAVLLWEGQGVQFDQTVTAPAVWAWWKRYVAKSA